MEVSSLDQIAQNFNSWCVTIANQSTPISFGILIIVTLIISLSLMVSSDARKNAIKWIPWVLVGMAGALSTVSIATAIGNSVQF